MMSWNSSGPPQQIRSKDNELLRKACQIASAINEYFYDKIQDIRKELCTKEWLPNICKDIMKGKKCSLYLQFPTKKEVTNILKTLSSSKSTAGDGLNNYRVKIAADVISAPLHHIVTLSIMQERFPDPWKYSKIIPLHKKDDVLQAKNYRPVSILSPLSKVLEKVVYKQLYSYLSRNTILHPNLHG